MTDPVDPAAAFTARTGMVATFDEARGAGEIADDDLSHRWAFHCTRIADGSRTIDPGTRVTFLARPGPTGLEAVAVAPVGPTSN